MRSIIKHIVVIGLFVTLTNATVAGLDPYNNLLDASRELARNKNPAPLLVLADSSPSSWIRQQAHEHLADYYATNQIWSELAKLVDSAKPCAQLRLSLHKAETKQSQRLAILVLQQKTTDKLCIRALTEASASGVLVDNQIWYRIRGLVSERKTKQSRLLLPLLKTRVSNKTFNQAVQSATKRITAKKPKIASETDRELMGVSAIVAALSRPEIVATAFDKIDEKFEVSIRNQVWAEIAHEAALDHNSKALDWFKKASLDGNNSTFSYDNNELAWRTRSALRANDWQEVLDSIEVMNEEQRALSAWQFWRAEALGKLGKTRLHKAEMEQIAANFDDYYGILAHEVLGKTVPRNNAKPDVKLARELLANDADIQLALALVKLGREGTARMVWKFWMRDKDGKNLLAASRAAALEGWLLGSINAADNAAPSHNHLALRFPTPHGDMVMQRSHQFSLSPAFVYSLIRQESRFNPKARSGAGALGMMQIMPATARHIARRYKYTRYNLSRLTLLNTNVLLGTTYLAELSKKLDGDEILIAAGYNAGPGRATRWARNSQGISRAVMIETIPFLETRLYVKSLLANKFHYGRILNGHADPLSISLTGSY